MGPRIRSAVRSAIRSGARPSTRLRARCSRATIGCPEHRPRKCSPNQPPNQLRIRGARRRTDRSHRRPALRGPHRVLRSGAELLCRGHADHRPHRAPPRRLRRRPARPARARELHPDPATGSPHLSRRRCGGSAARGRGCAARCRPGRRRVSGCCDCSGLGGGRRFRWAGAADRPGGNHADRRHAARDDARRPGPPGRHAGLRAARRRCADPQRRKSGVKSALASSAVLSGVGAAGVTAFVLFVPSSRREQQDAVHAAGFRGQLRADARLPASEFQRATPGRRCPSPVPRTPAGVPGRRRDRAGGRGGAADDATSSPPAPGHDEATRPVNGPIDPLPSPSDASLAGPERRRAAAHQRLAALEQPARRGRDPVELRHLAGQLDRDPRRRLARSQRHLRHAGRRRPDLGPHPGGRRRRAEGPLDRARALRSQRPDGLDQRRRRLRRRPEQFGQPGQPDRQLLVGRRFQHALLAAEQHPFGAPTSPVSSPSAPHSSASSVPSSQRAAGRRPEARAVPAARARRAAGRRAVRVRRAVRAPRRRRAGPTARVLHRGPHGPPRRITELLSY